MKIVLTCGDPLSGYADVHLALLAAGLQAARVSRQEKLSAMALQQKICAAHDADALYGQEPVQLAPGVVWHSLCVDLFMANLDVDAWGWADHATINLLDFWRDFDPQTRFVLVYSSPERTIGRLLNGANGSSGLDVEAAIGAWVHYNRAMLRFFLRNRDRCALVNTEALSLVSPSSRLLSFLPGDLGERLPDVVQAASLDATDPVIRKLAPELLASMPHAEALYQELEASADIATPSTARDLVTVQSVLEQYFSVKVKLVEADARAIESQVLISALQEQVDEQHDTVVQKTQLQAAMQKTNQQLETQVLQYRSQVAQLLDDVAKARGESTESAGAREENALLLLQLHQVQEELETVFLRETQAQQLRSEAQAGAVERALQLSALQDRLEEERKKALEKDRLHQAAQEGRVKSEKEVQQLRSQATQLQQDAVKARQEAAAGRESKEENALLLMQLHQVQEELETVFLRETQAQQLRSEAQAGAVERALQLSALQDRLEEERKKALEKDRLHQAAQEGRVKSEKEVQQLRSQATQLQQDAVKARQEAAAGRESKEENALLLMQLHQVQEELETYFLKYQELASKRDSDGATAGTSAQGAVSDVKLADKIEVDLRGQIDGDNWYYAEADGRWAGPHSKSVLRFPAPTPGRYQLVLGVVGAMDPDIVRDMKISFNEQLLAHKGPREWTFMHKLFRRKRYPATVVATVDVAEQPSGSTVGVELEFTRLISPVSRGSDDKRQLAVRVQYARLVMLAPTQ
jgi:hypothetical protein